MKYRYRKVTPEIIERMKELRATGMTYKKIGEGFDLGLSTVQYHLVPATKKRCIERAKAYSKTHPSKNDKEYIKNYIKERYNNDEEFRKRYIVLVQKSFNRRRTKWIEKGLCSLCGGEKENTKFRTCEKCRLKNRKK